MKTNLYVIRCKKSINGSKVGLCSTIFKKGHYITYEGTSTSNINKAYIYGQEEYQKDLEEHLEEHFEQIFINIKPISFNNRRNKNKI